METLPTTLLGDVYTPLLLAKYLLVAALISYVVP
jgi:hypothetical protein